MEAISTTKSGDGISIVGSYPKLDSQKNFIFTWNLKQPTTSFSLRAYILLNVY